MDVYSMDMKHIEYWIKLYIEWRAQGLFEFSDELREMLRRMGYEIRTTKNGVEAREIKI